MSQENLEIVRRMYEAFHAGDAEGALACFDPEVVVDTSGRVDGGIGHGHDDLSRMIAVWVGAFEEWREEIEEMRDLGGQVYVLANQFGRGKGSGVEVELRYAMLYQVEEGRIPGLTVYLDPAEALKAAGVAE